ncbi:MAG: SUMF1/EgtB/PvdO family nonheme iron enzyme [Planctomycetota bacterium]|jgi:formylglycine-generating enzyme required for sulfatase activity
MKGKLLITVAYISAFLVVSYHADASGMPKDKVYTNSAGMNFVRIEPGTFSMGCLNPTKAPGDELKWRDHRGPEFMVNGDWDEHPVHKVTISKAFYMSETEVTIEQFQKYRPDFKGPEKYGPYVTNICWNEATAFCKWLSEKEGKPYRLPTEAEWEYACRAGTKTFFSSGNVEPPKQGVANAWGLKNMHTLPMEWCLDWHGEYSDEDQVDPIGYDWSLSKVARGGGLVRLDEPYFLRSANRGGYVPYFPPFGRDGGNVPSYQRQMPVGFRLVLGAKPDTKPLTYRKPFIQQCVKQDLQNATQGPDPDKPYFRKRPALPVPPENMPKVNRRRALLAAGLHPGFIGMYRSQDHENEGGPEVGVITARLRFGTDQWSMPDMFYDFPDTNRDGGILLRNENGMLYRFGKSYRMPMQWSVSSDNGVTFSEERFPEITGKIGGYGGPINSFFRTPDGTIFFGSDGGGSTSFLWASSDNGSTFFDTGGRTGGRHTTFVMLKDGRFLGLGGKERSIDGYTPKSISSDRGKTWVVTKTIFPALSSNQRPSLTRMPSGRLLFATDFQSKFGSQPKGMKRRGVYLAYSEDEGETWTVKKLPGAQLHEHAHVAKKANAEMIGYSTLRIGPNKLIHLGTTMNHPNLHFVFNETWLLQTGEESSEIPPEPAATKMVKVRKYKKYYPSSKLKCVYSGGTADNGRFLLHGNEKWYYENGGKKWDVTYDKGKKIGSETYWDEDGNKIWSWIHKQDGTSIWTHYWPNGSKKQESTWKDLKCQGKATRWARDGKVLDEVEFLNGMPGNSPPFVRMTGVVYPD